MAKKKPRAQGKAGQDSDQTRYSREDLRRDLARGVVTEPLPPHITEAPKKPYDIIIALNELFPKGNDVPLIASPGDVTSPAITWAFASLVASV